MDRGFFCAVNLSRWPYSILFVSGYGGGRLSDLEVRAINTSSNPALCLLADWGCNRQATVAVLVRCLHNIGRDDIVRVLSMDMNHGNMHHGNMVWWRGECLIKHKPSSSYPGLARHAATDMSAMRWGNDCKEFKLSHKPGVAGLNCGGWQYNKRNFTLLY